MSATSNLDFSFTGINSLRELTRVADVARVARCLSWYEAYQANRHFGSTLIAGKTQLVESIYDQLYKPCDKVALTGTRWFKSANDEVVTVAQILDGVPDDARYLAEQIRAMALWNNAARNLQVVAFDQRQGHVTPDIVVRFGAVDGEGDTLGVTTRISEGDIGSIVIPGVGAPVEIVMDAAELWTPEYFFTVFAHELGHALGHDHYAIRNLMYARYRGPRTTLGNQDRLFHEEKYGIPIAA